MVVEFIVGVVMATMVLPATVATVLVPVLRVQLVTATMVALQLPGDDGGVSLSRALSTTCFRLVS